MVIYDNHRRTKRSLPHALALAFLCRALRDPVGAGALAYRFGVSLQTATGPMAAVRARSAVDLKRDVTRGR